MDPGCTGSSGKKIEVELGFFSFVILRVRRISINFSLSAIAVRASARVLIRKRPSIAAAKASL